MAYEITRNYDTDFSRDHVQTVLDNVAHEIVEEVYGRELPTKSVFETPEIVDEDDNWFRFTLRPTVRDAGFTATDLVPFECVRHGEYYIRMLGHDYESASVIVCRPRSSDVWHCEDNTIAFEDLKQQSIRRNAQE